MTVELINTGTELLLGHVTNTHLPWLAQQLFGLGWRISRQITVPDGAAIQDAVAESKRRADLIIVTGGLGPTSDDITREVVAKLLGRNLVFHQEIWDAIQKQFARRKLVPSEAIRVQAMVPEGAVVLPNENGTAPGLLLEEGSTVIILLPGPPSELVPMWTHHALPWLKANRLSVPVYERIWNIVGMGESHIQDLCEEELRKLGDFEIGYCARAGEVDFRLIGSDPNLLDQASAIIHARVGAAIVGEGSESLEQVVIRLATEKKQTLATAESCTGGLIAHRLTNVPGSSAVFGFGWVTYANAAKIQELGVPANLLGTGGPGAVSELTVRAMADGGRQLSGADIAVAVSGIAGPSGGSPERPVGTCWMACSTKSNTTAFHRLLSQDREIFKYMATQAALDLFRRELLKA